MLDIRKIDREQILEVLHEEAVHLIDKAMSLAEGWDHTENTNAHLEAFMLLREASAVRSVLSEIKYLTKHSESA